jgi:hypothetical protein
MTLHAKLLSVDDEQNAFARLVVQETTSMLRMREFHQH